MIYGMTGLINLIIMMVFIGGIIWVVLYIFLSRLFSPVSAKWITHGTTLTLLGAFLISLLITVIPEHYFGKPRHDHDEVVAAILFSFVISLNLVAMPFFYWLDKKRALAGNDTHRIPEKILHLFAFIGGGVGAVICQQVFRHKTQKSSFQTLSILALLISLVIITTTFKDFLAQIR